ncbi:hypothetical protein ABK040_008955 [Willaertia magna]
MNRFTKHNKLLFYTTKPSTAAFQQTRNVRIELITGETCTPIRFEKEVERTLKGNIVPSIDGVAGWNEHVASYSESIIKAERETSGKTITDFQKETLIKIERMEEIGQFPFDGFVTNP